MRFLCIERKRSFAAALATMKVYIEDSVAGDLQINGVLCRKLGTLKNGETANFRISEAAAKVFVICDRVSKDFCFDSYDVPAGSANIALSGNCILNPIAGNPFRFSGEETKKDRKLRNKILLIGGISVVALIAAAVIIGMAMRSRVTMGDSQVFTVDDMQITLTKDFVEFDAEGYARAFDSKHVAIMVLQEEFTLMEGLENYSLSDYGELVLANNKNTKNDGLQAKEGVMYFEYETVNREDGQKYCYIVTMYKGPDAFWLIQYIVHVDKVESCRDYIFDWASSVTFKK